MATTKTKTIAPPTGNESITFRAVSDSSLYTMIPSVVRSRIPVLRSIHHTARSIVTQSRKSRQGWFAVTCADTSRDGSIYNTLSTAEPGRATTPTTRASSPAQGMPSQDLSLTMLSEPETTSGVDWEIVMSGIRLWTTAKAQATRGGDPVALRSMHIDALRYMHMALPTDLTDLEIQSLKASMSSQFLPRIGESGQTQERRQPNILRQGVAQTVCWLIAGVLLVLPVIMTLLQRLLQFERQHQVTERVIANSVQVTSTLGDRGIELHQALIRFKEGRLGGACLELASWVLEGVVGGVNDGLDAAARSQREAL